MTRITPGGLQTRFYTQEWTQNVCFSRIRTAICPIRLPDDRERVSQNGHLHWIYTVWDNWIRLKSPGPPLWDHNFLTRQNFSSRFVLKHIYFYISLREKRSYIDPMARFFDPDREKKLELFFPSGYTGQQSLPKYLIKRGLNVKHVY